MKINTRYIKIAAEDRGWSQRELARRAGVDPSVLSRAKRTASVHPSTARRIADALGVAVADVADR